MGRQSADGHLIVKRMRAGQKLAVIENVTIWAETTWAAYADHGDDYHIVSGKEKYVADTINLNDYYLWQGKATDTNNYYSVYAIIWKIETTTDNKKKLYLRTKYYTIATKGDRGNDGKSISSVDVVYQAGTSGTDAPTGSWVTDAPSLAPGQYLWQAQLITTMDYKGSTTTETVGATCIASADNFKTAVERYAQTTNRNSPPANDSSEWKEGLTTGMAAKDGYYIWSQTKITWQNGAVTYTTAVCITGDKGETGDTGPAALQYIIECDNETPNITNGAVDVTVTAYTQLGQEQRKQATIKEGTLWWIITKGQQPASLLGITNPMKVSVSQVTKVQLCNWNGIVQTKTITPVKDGRPGDPGVQGLQGCIIRVSEWVVGVEYHNDEALTSGTRYLDIAVVTTGANTYKAYKCRVTHTATADNAPVAGTTTTQWEPFNSMAPIYTPLLLADNALLRLAQTNRIVVYGTDSNVTGGMQGNATQPIIWAGSTTPTDGKFRVTADGYMYASKGTFAGTLDGVSGTFESLGDKSGKCSITFQDNGFFFSGYTRFYNGVMMDSDVYIQGGGRLYASDILCRGTFGHESRYTAVVKGTYMQIYDEDTSKALETINLSSAKTADGTTYYKIPLYSPGNDEENSKTDGVPIDLVVFNTTSDYYYAFTDLGNGKSWDVVNGNDGVNVHICDVGGWGKISGGACHHYLYINPKFITPTPPTTSIAPGVFKTAGQDLNW